MFRRLSALLGMILIVAMLAALIWTVHMHRQRLGHPVEADEMTSEIPPAATPSTEGANL
jgi:hypothetical protein